MIVKTFFKTYNMHDNITIKLGIFQIVRWSIIKQRSTDLSIK